MSDYDDDDIDDEVDYNAVDEADVVDDDDDDDQDDDDRGANLIEGATAAAVLEYITKSVVDEPDAVDVESSDGRRGSVSLEVHVADDDMGRVIGKRGRVANAIRTVVRAAAARDGVEVDVEFVE